jgi:MoaA/NifB/PqqE/SkfB family radical SAM enzyme
MIDKEQLLDSKHFCVLPFIHSCVWTDGRAIPCCINQNYILGDTKTQKMSDIYSNSNSKLKEIQQQMINGPELPESCSRCALPEQTYGAHSYRWFSNRNYGDAFKKLEFDENDNLVGNKIATWDVRFSNLCNLKCRTCDHINSSSIAEETVSSLKRKVPVLQKAFDEKNDFFEFFKNNLDSIEEIYFCGGEPLLLAEHYEILDILVEHKKFDLVLRYNTNCTRLTFKDKNVVTDYWNLFKKVRLSLSLDAGWEQASIIRNGSTWDNILSNLRTIKQNCPDIYLQLCPTISILNAFHLPKMHLFLADEGIIHIDNIYYNILTDPVMYNLTSLPKDKKELVEQHWLEYAKKCESYTLTDVTINEIHKVIKYMYSSNTQTEIDNLKTETKLLDGIRKENTIELFPELKGILE